jgi:hypothetical protein
MGVVMGGAMGGARGASGAAATHNAVRAVGSGQRRRMAGRGGTDRQLRAHERAHPFATPYWVHGLVLSLGASGGHVAPPLAQARVHSHSSGSTPLGGRGGIEPHGVCSTILSLQHDCTACPMSRKV